jgi:DNA-dependent RNA polymerase auxiliary subunit epsilon
MRYTYKVRELTPEPDNIVDVGEAKQMEAMSLKKLRRKLDHKKKYHIEYRNKKNNFVSATIQGIDNG